jgi:nitroreductase
MDFDEVVRRRRMVRNYLDAPVDGDVLTRILDRASRGPSAGFSQGVSFVAVTDPATRREIARLAGEGEYVSEGFDPWISRAPVHVMICVRKGAYFERYREADKDGEQGPKGSEEGWPIPYWWVDGGASMMLLLLAAVDEGLAAGFLGAHNIDAIEELLGIPEDVSPVGIVTIGHPAPDRRSGSLSRGRRSDTVRRERWDMNVED